MAAPTPPAHGRTEKNLFITIVLNFIITAVEIVGGIVSGSLALLSDALHNLADGLALVISYGALQLSKRPRTDKYTFGLKRAEIIAAIINATSLLIISFFLIKASIQRLAHPQPVQADIMLLVAVVGLAANLIGSWLVRSISAGSLNLRAAYFHLVSDALSSLAVIIGAFAILLFQVTWLDPLVTLLISLYILRETWSIIVESVDVILMASPKQIDINELVLSLESLPEVKGVHHVHLWQLNETDTHLEAHIQVADMYISHTAAIQKMIEGKLAAYAIGHVTLQFECTECGYEDRY